MFNMYLQNRYCKFIDILVYNFAIENKHITNVNLYEYFICEIKTTFMFYIRY